MEPISNISSLEERTVKQNKPRADADSDTVICAKCGVQAVPLHLGCRLCEDCCDCRPLGT